MTALIPIRENDGKQAVSGRDLHDFLEVSTRYNDWFARMVEYGFTEREDYVLNSEYVRSETRGRDYQQADHVLTLDMAKELAMIQRTPRGQQARRYFIEVEKRSRNTAPDLSTPEGVLALAQTLTKTAEELVAAKHAVAELKPLASQARTFNKAKGNTGRQQFARGIVNWALDNGYTVKFDQVYEFMSGKKLDLFVHGVGRSDHGHASTSGLRRGLSATTRDESRINGHKYAQGVLTPDGYEYAWSRIESYITEHGNLELPKKGIAA